MWVPRTRRSRRIRSIRRIRKENNARAPRPTDLNAIALKYFVWRTKLDEIGGCGVFYWDICTCNRKHPKRTAQAGLRRAISFHLPRCWVAPTFDIDVARSQQKPRAKPLFVVTSVVYLSWASWAPWASSTSLPFWSGQDKQPANLVYFVHF